MFSAKCRRHWTSSPDSCTLWGWLGSRESGALLSNVLRTLTTHRAPPPISLRLKDPACFPIWNKNRQSSLGSEFRVTKTQNRKKASQLLHSCTAYRQDVSALRQHFKYSLLVCDMKRVFLLHDIMQWDLGRSVERPHTQKCNEPIVPKTLYCTLTYH